MRTVVALANSIGVRMPLLVFVTMSHSCFDRTAGVGESCDESGHRSIVCEQALYCDKGNVCRRPAGLNQPCPERGASHTCGRNLICNTLFEPDLCTPQILPGERCQGEGIGLCAENFLCHDLDTPGQPVCKPVRTDGETCRGGWHCAGGLSCLPQARIAGEPVPPSRCGSPRTAGGLCDDKSDCVEGTTCNRGFNPPQCQKPGDVGAPCGDGFDCLASRCDTATKTCPASRG